MVGTANEYKIVIYTNMYYMIIYNILNYVINLKHCYRSLLKIIRKDLYAFFGCLLSQTLDYIYVTNIYFNQI